MIDELGQIDLANPDHYVEAIPFAWFDRLRHDHPVVWHPEQPPNRGFWAITRHDDLTAIHMDWETFSSEIGAVGLEELDEEQLQIRNSMLETDPPRHTQMRKICSKRFSARGVGVYEEWIRDVARGVLDRALTSGEPFDFVSEISRELPIRFLCSIFTVPQEDAPALIEWGAMRPTRSGGTGHRRQHRATPAPGWQQQRGSLRLPPAPRVRRGEPPGRC